MHAADGVVPSGRVPTVREEDTARAFPGRERGSDALGRVLLSEGCDGPQAGRAGDHASGLVPAAVVCAFRSWGGRRVVRIARAALLWRDDAGVAERGMPKHQVRDSGARGSPSHRICGHRC